MTITIHIPKLVLKWVALILYVQVFFFGLVAIPNCFTPTMWPMVAEASWFIWGVAGAALLAHKMFGYLGND